MLTYRCDKKYNNNTQTLILWNINRIVHLLEPPKQTKVAWGVSHVLVLFGYRILLKMQTNHKSKALE